MKKREYTSQYLSPPIILSLSMQEIDVLETFKDRFTAIGFEIEPFGGDEYAVRAIPDNLFGIAKKELLLEMLDSLSDGLSTSLEPELIDEKIASMSCKAAVKGNMKLSYAEMDEQNFPLPLQKQWGERSFRRIRCRYTGTWILVPQRFCRKR